MDLMLNFSNVYDEPTNKIKFIDCKNISGTNIFPAAEHSAGTRTSAADKSSINPYLIVCSLRAFFRFVNLTILYHTFPLTGIHRRMPK